MNQLEALRTLVTWVKANATPGVDDNEIAAANVVLPDAPATTVPTYSTAIPAEDDVGADEIVVTFVAGATGAAAVDVQYPKATHASGTRSAIVQIPQS